MKFLFLPFIVLFSSFSFNQDSKEIQESFPKYGIGITYGPGFGSAIEEVVGWPSSFPSYNYYSSLGSSFSVGVHTDMLFKKWFGLNIGVDFLKFESRREVATVYEIIDFNSQSFIDIPILLTFHAGKRIGFYAHIGISPSFRILKSFGEIRHLDNGSLYKRDFSTLGNVFAFNIVGQLSAGIEFIANEHFRFRLNPTFKIQVVPEKQQYIKKNYWSTTFDVSVFYYF